MIIQLFQIVVLVYASVVYCQTAKQCQTYQTTHCFINFLFPPTLYHQSYFGLVWFSVATTPIAELKMSTLKANCSSNTSWFSSRTLWTYTDHDQEEEPPAALTPRKGLRAKSAGLPPPEDPTEIEDVPPLSLEVEEGIDGLYEGEEEEQGQLFHEDEELEWEEKTWHGPRWQTDQTG